MTHAKLREAAEAATPGPWFETEGHPSGRAYGIHAEAGPVVVFRGIAKPHGQGEHNAAFIALANPTAILALLDEIAEQADENNRWCFRMADVREASGIGVSPMLDEVPDALRAMRATITRLEAELSAARAGLLSARQQIGNMVFNLNQQGGTLGVPSIVRSLESVLASTAAITGGE